MILFNEDCIKLKDCQVQEIKNDLAVILGNAELVLRSERLVEDERRQLEAVKKAVWEIDNILSPEEKEKK